MNNQKGNQTQLVMKNRANTDQVHSLVKDVKTNLTRNQTDKVFDVPRIKKIALNFVYVTESRYLNSEKMQLMSSWRMTFSREYIEYRS